MAPEDAHRRPHASADSWMRASRVHQALACRVVGDVVDGVCTVVATRSEPCSRSGHDGVAVTCPLYCYRHCAAAERGRPLEGEFQEEQGLAVLTRARLTDLLLDGAALILAAAVGR